MVPLRSPPISLSLLFYWPPLSFSFVFVCYLWYETNIQGLRSGIRPALSVSGESRRRVSDTQTLAVKAATAVRTSWLRLKYTSSLSGILESHVAAWMSSSEHTAESAWAAERFRRYDSLEQKYRSFTVEWLELWKGVISSGETHVLPLPLQPV